MFATINVLEKSIFDRIAYLDESFHCTMDLEFLIRAFKYNLKIGQIDDILGAQRLHDETKTNLKGEVWKNDYITLANLYKDSYSITPNKLVQSYYRLIKLFKGLYFKQILFILNWKGKKLLDFNSLTRNL